MALFVSLDGFHGSVFAGQTFLPQPRNELHSLADREVTHVELHPWILGLGLILVVTSFSHRFYALRMISCSNQPVQFVLIALHHALGHLSYP